MNRRTPLFDAHVALGARMTGFGGWDMPVHYGSQIEEHHAVRRIAGVFDVSHMTVVDITGAGSCDWLRRLLANDVARLDADGRGLYSCMLNEAGGVVDDLIAYRRGAENYRLVVNAATRDKDLEWMRRQAAGEAVAITELADKVMLAVQGPRACQRLADLLPHDLAVAMLALRPFSCLADDGWFVARTGYTGEDGVELVTDAGRGARLFADLAAAGVQPCGLGARDTLRLEAGLALYGQDMDEETSPLEAGLGWTVSWQDPERMFTGRAALEKIKAEGPARLGVGLVLEDRGIMRHGQRVLAGDGTEGVVTSGGFSPTLQRSIALARLPRQAGAQCEVEIRNRRVAARVVKPPFVRNGEIKVDL